MTENKRYSYNHLGVIFDNTRFDVPAMSVKEIVESLNRLSDENEELKNSNHTLAQNLIKSLDMRIRLEKENKQLNYNYNEKCNEYCGLEEQVDILLKENEQLKKEKESWKSNACSLASLNSILSNELSIAQEKGYETSEPYKKYIASVKTEYDDFWENKIKKHNNRMKDGDEE